MRIAAMRLLLAAVAAILALPFAPPDDPLLAVPLALLLLAGYAAPKS